ncbi:glycoside hydrolase family 3 N-terminal domain-containing protein [Chitinilyticum litopenaei]|uniref:glycoside hydrolase family 3 N-terminal domain-containing protein n=1 Tax=Chitinilyticum litopenaei TaxID=1121276 RepID=UPI000427100F|nr:glycoside hydrolase family 3 N-terminal domain-containing protein [Chitinilyticum litopenaei]
MFDTHREQAAALIAGWSIEEKVGQLFILAFPGKDAEAARTLIERYNLGGCYLSEDNASTFAEARRLTGDLDAIVRQRTAHVPLLLGVDQEGAWSVVTRESVTGPGNLALGKADDAALTASVYAMLAEEMRSAGFNCILGPCSDVNLTPNSPIIDTRAFGEVPLDVARHAAAAVRGGHAGGIVMCAKHFPGHGDTVGDTHRLIPQVDKSFERLQQEDLLPFKHAIDAGVELVMTSHIRYPQIDSIHPATLSAPILQGVLRQHLGFAGIVISDSMNMGAIRSNYAPEAAALLAFAAGIDMIMLSEEHYDHNSDYQARQLAMIAALVEAARAGRFPTLDETVERVVAFKLSRLQQMPLLQPFDLAAHQALAARAAATAVRVQRDPQRILPLAVDGDVIVVRAARAQDYANLVNPRGIGPNQATPAFDHFVDELGRQGAAGRWTVLTHEEAQAELGKPANRLTRAEEVVIVTENYPLPGEDFRHAEAQALVAKLAAARAGRLLVVGLRSNYEPLPEGVSYLCAYSSRECSARAAAHACLAQPQAAADREAALAEI